MEITLKLCETCTHLFFDADSNFWKANTDALLLLAIKNGSPRADVVSGEIAEVLVPLSSRHMNCRKVDAGAVPTLPHSIRRHPAEVLVFDASLSLWVPRPTVGNDQRMLINSDVHAVSHGKGHSRTICARLHRNQSGEKTLDQSSTVRNFVAQPDVPPSNDARLFLHKFQKPENGVRCLEVPTDGGSDDLLILDQIDGCGIVDVIV